MHAVYRAKFSFKKSTLFQEPTESEASKTRQSSTRSTPTSPSSSRVNNSEVSAAHHVLSVNNVRKCPTKMSSDVAVLRSPVLNVKLEKCSSEPSVFVNKSVTKSVDRTAGDKGSGLKTTVTSSRRSSKSEDSLAGISTTTGRESLIVTFEEGDLFQVLSKEDHSHWWIVRSLSDDRVGFAPANYLTLCQDWVGAQGRIEEDEDLKSQLLSELRRRIGDLEPGALFPVSMIPEPDVYAPGGDLEKRNRRNTSVPVAPPLPHLNMEGLILPRKPQNPCLESSDHKNLHRELLFNQKIGKNVLNQKSELQKALEKHKESQVKKELEHQKETSKSVLERVIEERARRLETLEKCEEDPNRLNGAPEFLQVHAKLRARMNSK